MTEETVVTLKASPMFWISGIVVTCVGTLIGAIIYNVLTMPMP